MTNPGKIALLAPLRPVRNRTTEVIERIADEISSGRLAPGARLPTEQHLMEAMGVSRTVVREAVAALKADGLVITRQGAGAFVALDRTRVPFRIDPDGLSSLDDVINIMELRLAIEVEGAALAAERLTASAFKAIDRSLDAIDAAIARDEPAIEEDFAFHRAIAEATQNPLYVDFLAFLGRHVIPRQSIRTALTGGAEQTSYLQRIQTEHRQISTAIKKRDPAAARRAARCHLANSLARYRQMAGRTTR